MQSTLPPPTPEQVKAAAAMPFRNPALPIDRRVDDLVSRLTLEEKVSQVIDRAAAIPRLDIPAYNWWNEGLHGIARSGFATMFPQAIGNAATWDAPLVHQIGDVISTEARAKYNDAIRHDTHARYYGSPSGRRTSTSFAIRAGAAARRRMAKIRSSPLGWARRL
jgi:beta-glucosidase